MLCQTDHKTDVLGENMNYCCKISESLHVILDNHDGDHQGPQRPLPVTVRGITLEERHFELDHRLVKAWV